MGCFYGKPGRHSSKKNSKLAGEKPAYSWDNKLRLNKKDYIIENLKLVTVGRAPGKVKGEQFIIQNCEQCNIYIFDYINTVTVDDCVDCNIFLGPTKGSVFLRDCKDCRLVGACQQFRARDCKGIDSFIYCATQPSIEACTSMRFACFCYHYKELEGQFQDAGLTVFNNSWCNIHDFTPVEGEKNWSLLPQDARVEDFFPMPTTDDLAQVQICTDPFTSVVPQTMGFQHRICLQSCLVVFFNDGQSHQRAMSFVRELERTSNALVKTKEAVLEKLDAERIFGTDSYNTVVKRGPVIALEYSGEDCISACQNTAKDIATETGSTGLVYISSNPKSATKQVENFFSYADMQTSF